MFWRNGILYKCEVRYFFLILLLSIPFWNHLRKLKERLCRKLLCVYGLLKVIHVVQRCEPSDIFVFCWARSSKAISNSKWQLLYDMFSLDSIFFFFLFLFLRMHEGRKGTHMIIDFNILISFIYVVKYISI